MVGGRCRFGAQRRADPFRNDARTSACTTSTGSASSGSRWPRGWKRARRFWIREPIDFAQSIPASQKMHVSDERNGESREKWILRKAGEDLLPADVVWRKKAQFDEGSGLGDHRRYKRHRRRRRSLAKSSLVIGFAPAEQQRTRNAMTPRRRRSLTIAAQAFLNNPDLLLDAPAPTSSGLHNLKPTGETTVSIHSHSHTALRMEPPRQGAVTGRLR